MNCPLCYGVMLKEHRYETVELHGKNFGAEKPIYKCRICEAEFSTTQTDTDFMNDLKEEK